jgi:hypothetical protein
MFILNPIERCDGDSFLLLACTQMSLMPEKPASCIGKPQQMLSWPLRSMHGEGHQRPRRPSVAAFGN